MARISRRVSSVTDGDTFSVSPSILRNGRSWSRIRIANFYAPEKGETGWSSAKAKLDRLVRNKTVSLDVRGVSYDRLVCDVYLNELNIKTKL